MDIAWPYSYSFYMETASFEFSNVLYKDIGDLACMEVEKTMDRETFVEHTPSHLLNWAFDTESNDSTHTRLFDYLLIHSNSQFLYEQKSL